MDPAIRPAVVAGRFYSRDPETLLSEVRSYLTPGRKAVSAVGCVTPHAGHMYSGHVAGAVFATIALPRHCIILCPNHTGRGSPLAVMSHGAWGTPLGMAPIDSSLAAALQQNFPLLSEDAEAHRSEHAIEVELPFLQALRPDCEFVPIALGTAQFEILEALGEAVAETVKAQSEPVLMIASSDMNHYENDDITRIKDQKAIERILAMDARGLFDVVIKEDISMCGFGPAVVMLTAAKCLGADSAELIKYATSGDVSGDREMVVGYAGIVVR